LRLEEQCGELRPDRGEVHDIARSPTGHGPQEAAQDRELLEVVDLVVLGGLYDCPGDAGLDPVVAGALPHRAQPESLAGLRVRAVATTARHGDLELQRQL